MAQFAPQIGFDRFIPLEWAAAALRVRAGLETLDELQALLDAAEPGAAARKKTQTVLNRLWLAPRPELAEFADRGVRIFKADSSVPVAAMTWGMAIASYPFFGKVSELVGRLSALQGDCASAQIQRRISETYGERASAYRVTNRVLQSQANWGAIERAEKGRRLVRLESIAVSNEWAVAWLLEAALCYMGRPVSLASLSSLAALYPFALKQPVAYVASKSPRLELRSQGAGNQCVCWRVGR